MAEAVIVCGLCSGSIQLQSLAGYQRGCLEWRCSSSVLYTAPNANILHYKIAVVHAASLNNLRFIHPSF
jgi:hypothetical protein